MRSLEDRFNSTFHNREGLSYREIARRLGGNRRTVRKHAEHPADYGDRPGSASCGTDRRAQRSYAHRAHSRVRKAPCSARLFDSGVACVAAASSCRPPFHLPRPRNPSRVP